MIIWVFSKGYLFTKFHLDSVDTNKMKTNSYLLATTILFDNSLLGLRLYHTSSNLQSEYNSIVSIIYTYSRTKTKLFHYNSTTSEFLSTSVITVDQNTIIVKFYNYNSTLIYIWGFPENNSEVTIVVNLITNSIKTFAKNYESVIQMFYMDGQLYIQTNDINYNTTMTFYKTDLDLVSSSSCNQFAISDVVLFTLSEEDVQLQDIEMDQLSITLYYNYVLVYNLSQTPFKPFDMYITDMFWPQTKQVNNSTVCQPLKPQTSDQFIIWNLNEINLEFKFVPFTQCQGVPINITFAKSSILNDTEFLVNGSSITVYSGYTNRRNLDSFRRNAETIISPNSTIDFILTGKTNTIVPLVAYSTFTIKAVNYSPVFSQLPNNLTIMHASGLNIKIVYKNYCDSSLDDILVYDKDLDTIFFTRNIDNQSNIEYSFNQQNCSANFYLDTTKYEVGTYYLNLSIWDMFTTENHINISLNLNVLSYTPPNFKSAMQSTFDLQICNKFTYILPEIVDLENDFSHVELIGDFNYLIIVNSSLLDAYPKSENIGHHQITIRLIDLRGLYSDYLIAINIEDNFYFIPQNFSFLKIRFPSIKEIDISDSISQFKNKNITVKVFENSKIVNWAVYKEENNSILISNYNKNDEGTHNLTLSIYNSCYSKSFDSFILIGLIINPPPVAVNTISDIKAYQGETIQLLLAEDLFFDPDDSIQIYLHFCTNILIKTNVSSKQISSDTASYYLNVDLDRNFIGICKSQAVALDTFSQTATIDFSIDVHICPQIHCQYCSGPNKSDCIQCKDGYTLNSYTKECEIVDKYFDRWIILVFTAIVLLMTVFTDHDLNVSYILLESITIYWIMFLPFKNNSLYIKHYFDQIDLIITQLNSAVMPLFGIFKNTNSNILISNSLLVNCMSILFIIAIFVISNLLKTRFIMLSKYSYYFRITALSKYMLWTSTYIWFCAFYEIINANNLTSFGVLSLIITLILIFIGFLLSFCLIIYSNQNCFLCNKYKIFQSIRNEFIMFDRLDRKNYEFIIRYNYLRKLVIPLSVLVMIKLNLFPFIFIFLFLSCQLTYFNFLIGRCHFSSLVTRWMSIINELIITFVVLFICMEFQYLTATESENSVFLKIMNLIQLTIRIHILSLCSIEIGRAMWYLQRFEKWGNKVKEICVKVLIKIKRNEWRRI